ncbi:MAG TPA: hypothetical protein VFL79_15175, partial [Terriglobia bacterium]|nr:hypothetical protein [Terriglobia bacterium]
EGVRRPQSVSQFFPAHHFPRPLQQYRQDLYRAALDWQAHTMFPQFSSAHGQFKSAEPHPVP